METLLIVLCVVVVLLSVVVFFPVVIAVDSRKRQLRIRWLAALEFQMPLPGTAGQKYFSVFHKPFPVREKRPGAEKKEEPSAASEAAEKAGGRRQSTVQFFARCLGDSGIRGALARKLSMLIRGVFRSADLKGTACDVSLPDPALNGMLAGALAASNFGGEQRIRVNFTGENNLLLELRLHPHRVFKAFLFFLPGLPYRAVFRQWRAFSAARPH